MSGARERILAAVRKGRENTPEPEARKSYKRTRARGDVDAFCERLRTAGATVERIIGRDDVPKAVARHLAARNLEARAVVSPALSDIPWTSKGMLEVRVGIVGINDATAVVPVRAGIAETGSLVHTSAPDDPTINHFLPENAIAVISVDDIRVTLEDAFALTNDSTPRSLCLITGPSRTGDIEQKIELGAHGPRSLHVLVIGESTAGKEPFR